MWLGWILACAPPTPMRPPPANNVGEMAVESLIVTDPPPRPATEARYAATAVLVSWKDAPSAPPGVTRTEEEALAIARSIRDRALRGEDLAAIAAAESDALRGRSGNLGMWATGTMDPGFERAVAAVDPGGIAPLAETAEGWWIARRDPVEVRRIGEVLVSFQGAWRNTAGRTRAQAEARAAEALRRLDQGEPFFEVATTFSDAGRAGADLGLVGEGQLIPTLETAAWPLDVGEHTAVVESTHGLHVLIRLE